MVGRICDYLLSITTADGGVPFALPSVRDYPRAPWWESDDQPSASLNPTAAIAGLLHKHGVQHPWLAKATTYCWSQLDTLDQTSPYEMRAVLPFLDFVPDRRRAEEVFGRIGPKILQQKLVALTPTAEDDTHTLFSDDVIEADLDALASAQQEDGGWPFNWLAWNAATALEWRGVVTVEALVTLRAYGREV
jgi:hypothetical protein